MEKITFKNGQAPYINDTNLNKMQDNIEKAIGDSQSREWKTLNATYGITYRKIGSDVEIKLGFQSEVTIQRFSGITCGNLPEGYRPSVMRVRVPVFIRQCRTINPICFSIAQDTGEVEIFNWGESDMTVLGLDAYVKYTV